MDLLLLAVRCAVGLTLGLAAALKVKDFLAFRASLVGYGLRGRAGGVAAMAVIAAEAATAVLAFAPPVGDLPVGGMAAGLGLVFVASQVYTLATGSGATCLCFGKASVEPVSARTVFRAALVLLAGFVLVAGAA